MNYNLNIIEMLVQEWSNEDGAGERTFSKGGVDMDIIIKGEVTRDSIVEVLKRSLGIEIENDMLNFDDEIGSFHIVEDNDAFQDESGCWLVNYVFTINPISDNLDLSFLEDEI